MNSYFEAGIIKSRLAAGKKVIFITSILLAAGLSRSRAQENNWTQKTDFGGTARYGATGFSIGSKGYMGTGFDWSFKNDFWEYDPATNAWTQKASFPGLSRQFAVGFSIGSKGYIGTGNHDIYGGSQEKDFWEYDPPTNNWTRKADFGGSARLMQQDFLLAIEDILVREKTLMGP